MIVALDWLKDFVAIDESPQELADLLTMLGMEADGISEGTPITGVVTVKIDSVMPHPNADKLKLCQVSDGSETYQIVCGAPNVREGQISLLAKIGAVLSGGFKIKPAKIRGEKSFGMLCSERELGLSDDHSGIMDLADSTELGQDATELFPQPLPAIDFDITPNRPDCLSHMGIAREIALKTEREFTVPELMEGDATDNDVRDYVDIIIDDPVGCPRYIAGVMTNIKIGPSPDWMVRRLEAAGQRSINNVVDISNYVLLELGHPTHIFDYKYVPTKKIVIRRAEAGDKITTLDEIERELNDQHLLITDGNKPVAIAGIMGSENSGVNETTDTVLIESAYFDPITVRKGSKALGLITEASRRFERGADPEGAYPAFWRIVNLLEKYAGGKQIPGLIDAYPNKITMPQVKLRKSALDLLSGCDISNTFVDNCLTGLEIDHSFNTNNSTWLCTPPTFRPDLEREIDLIEEIIRVFGYDNVPLKMNYTGIYNQDKQDGLAIVSKIAQAFAGFGFHQCFTNSLQNKNIANSTEEKPVELMNPLSEEMSHVRTSLLPGLLQSLEHNVHNGSPNLRLYEIGQVFQQTGVGFKGIVETAHLSGVVHGNLFNADVHSPKAVEHNHFSIKGIIDSLPEKFKLPGIDYHAEQDNDQFTDHFHLLSGTTRVGYFGKIQPEYIKKLGMDLNTVYSFDIDLDEMIRLIEGYHDTLSYSPISVFPKIERDLNFVLPNNVFVGDMVKKIIPLGQNILKSVYPLDLFRHESIGSDKKSVTLHFVFQSLDRTLEDNEVTSIINEVITVVERVFKAKLRS